MQQYETKQLGGNELLTNYSSFAILEGQRGLPDMIQEAAEVLNEYGCTLWILDNLFDPECEGRIKAIPLLNPDVLIFQTTLMSRDKIDDIITFLQGANYRPKEIWQLIRNDIPLIHDESYEFFSFYADTYRNVIEITKL